MAHLSFCTSNPTTLRNYASAWAGLIWAASDRILGMIDEFQIARFQSRMQRMLDVARNTTSDHGIVFEGRKQITTASKYFVSSLWYHHKIHKYKRQRATVMR